MEHDDEPELAGYQPHETPLRGARFRWMLRIAVVLGLIGLVLPGILTSVGVANRTALAACRDYTAYAAPDAVSFAVRFELVSASGVGWNCYAVGFGGTEILLAPLGVIPGGVPVPTTPVERT